MYAFEIRVFLKIHKQKPEYNDNLNSQNYILIFHKCKKAVPNFTKTGPL